MKNIDGVRCVVLDETFKKDKFSREFRTTLQEAANKMINGARQ